MIDVWTRFDRLLAESEIVIDRPAGRPHPRIPELVYPLDYGYVVGTSAMDGEGIDVWIGSTGARDLVALACTFDAGKRDAEVKLLLGCTERDVELIEGFNPAYMSYLVIWRPTATWRRPGAQTGVPSVTYPPGRRPGSWPGEGLEG